MAPVYVGMQVTQEKKWGGMPRAADLQLAKLGEKRVFRERLLVENKFLKNCFCTCLRGVVFPRFYSEAKSELKFDVSKKE